MNTEWKGGRYFQTPNSTNRELRYIPRQLLSVIFFGFCLCEWITSDAFVLVDARNLCTRWTCSKSCGFLTHMTFSIIDSFFRLQMIDCNDPFERCPPLLICVSPDILSFELRVLSQADKKTEPFCFQFRSNNEEHEGICWEDFYQRMSCETWILRMLNVDVMLDWLLWGMSMILLL